MSTSETEKSAPAVADARPAPAQAMARADSKAGDAIARLAGSYRDLKEINARLQFAAANAARVHLVSPSSICPSLGEGWSVVLSTVHVDVERETYPVAGGDDDGGGRGGKRGLSKVALDKIAAAAGVSWDPHLSRRLDDSGDPRYCAFVAVGRVRGLDGTETLIQGTKEMDLRDGSPQIEALEARARKKRKDASAQIRELRMHIVSHAETKARLRAVRSLGIRTAYAPAELSKPFVVCRSMFTGQSDDPELRRAFALKLADAALSARAMLYPPPTHAVALPAPAAAPPPRALERLADEDLDELPDLAELEP